MNLSFDDPPAAKAIAEGRADYEETKTDLGVTLNRRGWLQTRRGRVPHMIRSRINT